MRILLAADGSNPSIRAAHAAAELARQHPDAIVTVFYVVPTRTSKALSLARAARALLPNPGNEDFLESDEMTVQRLAAPILNLMVRELNLPPEKVDTLTASGNPAEEICRAAQTGNYDLIVLGRRGANPLAEILMGSTSNAILHGCPVPALVVQ